MKLKKLDIERRRLYENILLGLDFKVVRETVGVLIKERALKKQIKKKEKKKRGWGWFGSKIESSVSSSEKQQIQDLIDKIVEEEQTVVEMPDFYCHTVVNFNQRELHLDLRDGDTDLEFAWTERIDCIVSQIQLRLNLQGKGRRVRASMGRFAVFHVKRPSTSPSSAEKVWPILYSKNADEVQISRPLKSILRSEDLENERFYMNKICNRVVNGKPFLNSVLAEQDDLDSEHYSKFIEFKMTEKPLDETGAMTKE